MVLYLSSFKFENGEFLRLFCAVILIFYKDKGFFNAFMGWDQAFLNVERKKKGLYIQAQRLTGLVMLTLRDRHGRSLRPISLQETHRPVDERWSPRR